MCLGSKFYNCYKRLLSTEFSIKKNEKETTAFFSSYSNYSIYQKKFWEGKKHKLKKFGGRKVNSFLFENKLLLAALGEAATGISLAALLGAEKAKQLVDHIGESAKDITNKIENGFNVASDHLKSKDSKKTSHLEEQSV